MPNHSEVARARRRRVRMTSAERRDQLISVARATFAEKGFDGTSVEEIAARAEVSKPVVYEHFGGKEGLYAVVVDREVQALLTSIREAITTPNAGSRRLLELSALALLDYVERCPDGFRILMRDTSESGDATFASILADIVARVEGLLGTVFTSRGLDARTAPLIAQALTGMVAMTGQWWLDHPHLTKEEVASPLLNLAWNGMHNLQPEYRLSDSASKQRLARGEDEA